MDNLSKDQRNVPLRGTTGGAVTSLENASVSMERGPLYTVYGLQPILHTWWVVWPPKNSSQMIPYSPKRRWSNQAGESASQKMNPGWCAGEKPLLEDNTIVPSLK